MAGEWSEGIGVYVFFRVYSSVSAVQGCNGGKVGLPGLLFPRWTLRHVLGVNETPARASNVRRREPHVSHSQPQVSYIFVSLAATLLHLNFQTNTPQNIRT